MSYVRKTVSMTPQAHAVVDSYAKERGISFSSALSCIVYEMTGRKTVGRTGGKKVAPTR